MKHFIFICLNRSLKGLYLLSFCCLLSTTSNSQHLTIDTMLPSGAVTYEYAFAEFNTFQATSGYLIDRSFPFGKMDF